jgi:hypothetical protein
MRALLPLLLAGCAAVPAGPRVEVLVFVSADCPISNSYAPELNRIAAGHPGVGFTFVYADPSTPEDVMRRHAREHGFAAPVLGDEGRRLSKRHGATVTPEAVVLAGGDLVYRGRIDDRYLAPGQYRLAPTTRELRDAIECALAGRPAPVRTAPAAGCPIPE